MNRTAEEIIELFRFAVQSGSGISGLVIGDNELARVVAEFDDLRSRLDQGTNE